MTRKASLSRTLFEQVRHRAPRRQLARQSPKPCR